MPNYLKT